MPFLRMRAPPTFHCLLSRQNLFADDLLCSCCLCSSPSHHIQRIHCCFPLELHIIAISASVLYSYMPCHLLPSQLKKKKKSFLVSFVPSPVVSPVLFSFDLLCGMVFIAIAFHENTSSLRNSLMTFIMQSLANLIFVHVRGSQALYIVNFWIQS